MANLYFKDWKEADSTCLHQLTACTGNPGHLWPYPNDALPENIQCGMAGIRESFISGYYKPELIQSGLSAIAELVVAREDDGQGKGYVWPVAIGADGKVYYQRKPFKPEDGHYFDANKPVPVDMLFGKIPKNQK